MLYIYVSMTNDSERGRDGRAIKMNNLRRLAGEIVSRTNIKSFISEDNHNKMCIYLFVYKDFFNSIYLLVSKL